MPLYSFTCTTKGCDGSGKVIDAIVKLSASEKAIPCPLCKKPLRKLLSAPYFRIK